MFDPTIFENLKVVLEGTVYDLDLRGQLHVVGRQDRVELSTMSRYYALRFCLPEKKQIHAELRLWADTADLAAEIMELSQHKPGCSMQPVFYIPVRHPEEECPRIVRYAEEIWGARYEPLLEIRTVYGNKEAPHLLKLSLQFHRKFGEEIVDDFDSLLEHMMILLDRL
ncbi:hypothetical protein [Paenibacillus aceti]|uniref:Uncharacterized protein n=1 Tax=Paenibacillus aceti TaxID=1820010 RepID=A0ABQ1VSB2_9BACL|nr:hypothetical protein [Paenibacillus aceti]GGF94971.1 hypothetical protein GCM10010913_15640 [Paenibacillus aceti]